MRSAERASKTVAFRVTNAVTGCYSLRGGCNMGFGLKSTTAPFVYMTHSAVVISFETALPLRTREKGGSRERPPPNRGVMRPATDGVCTRLCTGPHGVAHVLIYPCGKAWKKTPFPSRFIVSDRSSPSRVRFAASRPGRLRADPKDALLTRGKRGVGPWGAERGIFPNGRRIDGTRRYRGNGIGREQSSER